MAPAQRRHGLKMPISAPKEAVDNVAPSKTFTHSHFDTSARAGDTTRCRLGVAQPTTSIQLSSTADAEGDARGHTPASRGWRYDKAADIAVSRSMIICGCAQHRRHQ